jgi:hypothetical protein
MKGVAGNKEKDRKRLGFDLIETYITPRYHYCVYFS